MDWRIKRLSDVWTDVWIDGPIRARLCGWSDVCLLERLKGGGRANEPSDGRVDGWIVGLGDI
jgi:hypothetical protein